MTSAVVEPGPEVVEAMRRRLSTLVVQRTMQDRRLGRADLRTLALALPHAIVTLALGEVTDRVPIEEAHRIAWGFVVLDGRGPVAMAEVAETGSVTISDGPFAAALVRAVERVDVDEEPVEVRVLRLPPIHTTVLWLHHPDGTGEVLTPITPAPADATAGRHYGLDELAEQLALVVRRPDAPPRSGG